MKGQELDLSGVPLDVRVAAAEHDLAIATVTMLRQGEQIGAICQRVTLLERSRPRLEIGYHPEVGLCTEERARSVLSTTPQVAQLEGELHQIAKTVAQVLGCLHDLGRRVAELEAGDRR